MERNDSTYRQYCQILRDELQMATGCTEPIAIAYCAAKARSVLHQDPVRVDIHVSGNIIKNVKSVIVPGTGGMKGIETAAAAGIVVGHAERKLQVLGQVQEEEREKIRQFLDRVPIHVSKLEGTDPLEILIELWGENENSSVRICHAHTHIVHFCYNGQELPVSAGGLEDDVPKADKSALSIDKICAFADCLHIDDVQEVLDRQMDCNTAIAREGLHGNWGARVGKIMLATGDGSVRTRAKAMAAAGSDARMSGCEMPVVINSGSGNQGMTVSLPVIEYFNASGLPREMLYRSLAVSNLCAIHAKEHIGELSAYCGAVTAGSAAAAGIAYLKTRDPVVVAHTIVNSLAITNGIICDGAKPSCAAKIAYAIDAGIFGMEMYLNGSQFYGGDGIIAKGIENTLKNVGILGSEGMRQTDQTILDIMLESPKAGSVSGCKKPR